MARPLVSLLLVVVTTLLLFSVGVRDGALGRPPAANAATDSPPVRGTGAGIARVRESGGAVDLSVPFKTVA